MRDDIPAAAFRLLCALPKRTVERKPARPVVPLGRPPGFKQLPPYRRKRLQTGVGRGGGQEQACVVAGRRYPSIGAARRALRIGWVRWAAMVEAGEAKVIGRSR